ncbi:MerR family transcriptional regulator [Demequina silvatica]|uniref:MerR family transcriptional regulator n=1 Tax=Demequina silvatica TaxID=1638988 RepID=UPI0007840D07|nr:MerR family transcriptional regulator [Demequina silvatica]
MHSGELLSIGQLAALSRLSVKALRHYDDQGLLTPVRVDPVSSYRFYSPDQIRRATLIGTMRRIDVPLPVIREILDGPHADAAPAFDAWWVAQERRHEQRRGLARYIGHQLHHQGEPAMDITTRTVPERTLAVIAREVYQPELDDFVMSAFVRLFDYAAAHPGLRPLDTTSEHPTYAIYHGSVTPDQSALVEVCVVVADGAPPVPGISIRLEPAHQEAFATLTRAQNGFPAILEAYDAVASWVLAHGEMVEDLPSREVYFTDVLAAGMDDPVCDVAFPYVAR